MHRASEVKVYQECYAAPDASYGMSQGRHDDAMLSIRQCTMGRLLDVGCGRGEVLRAARELGFECVGTEIVPELCGGNVVEAWPTDLPFHDKEFDVVTCFDVLEHTRPGDENAILAELCRVCKHDLILAINIWPSEFNGHVLHHNLKSFQDWLVILEALPGFQVVVARNKLPTPIYRLERV